jgi:hypothetical protein
MSNSRTPSHLPSSNNTNNSNNSNNNNNNGSPPIIDMLTSRRPPPLESIPHHSHLHYGPPPGVHSRPQVGWSAPLRHPQTRRRMLGPQSGPGSLGRAPPEASSSLRMVPPEHHEPAPMLRSYSDESQRSVVSNVSMRSQVSGERAEEPCAPQSGPNFPSHSFPHDDYESARLSGHADAQSEPPSHSRSPPRQRRTRVLMTKMQWHALMTLWEQVGNGLSNIVFLVRKY